MTDVDLIEGMVVCYWKYLDPEGPRGAMAKILAVVREHDAAHWQRAGVAITDAMAAARREAFADALQIFRGLAGDAMTPELETVLLMVDKAIARRVAGQ